MTDRASRKRRRAVPVEPETPHIPAENEGAPPAGDPRCEVCGWPLRPDGCAKGDCSYRPAEGTDEYRRIEARRSELAGHPGLVSPVAARMAAEGEPAKAFSTAAMVEGLHALADLQARLAGDPTADGSAADGPGDSAPYQLPDGTWEALTLDAGGRVTGRRTVEGPK